MARSKYKRNLRERARTRELNDQGLTARGTPRKLRIWGKMDWLGLHGKQRQAEREKLRRAEFVADGLTHQGKPRKNRCFRQWWGLPRNQRDQLIYRFDADRNLAAGLTTTGKTRYSAPLPAREQAWRDLRAGIVVEVATWD